MILFFLESSSKDFCLPRLGLPRLPQLGWQGCHCEVARGVSQDDWGTEACCQRRRLIQSYLGKKWNIDWYPLFSEINLLMLYAILFLHNVIASPLSYLLLHRLHSKHFSSALYNVKYFIIQIVRQLYCLLLKIYAICKYRDTFCATTQHLS